VSELNKPWAINSQRLVRHSHEIGRCVYTKCAVCGRRASWYPFGGGTHRGGIRQAPTGCRSRDRRAVKTSGADIPARIFRQALAESVTAQARSTSYTAIYGPSQASEEGAARLTIRSTYSALCTGNADPEHGPSSCMPLSSALLLDCPPKGARPANGAYSALARRAARRELCVIHCEGAPRPARHACPIRVRSPQIHLAIYGSKSRARPAISIR